MILDGFQLPDPAAAHAQAALLPRGLLGAAGTASPSLVLQDVRILVDAASLLQHVQFFRQQLPDVRAYTVCIGAMRTSAVVGFEKSAFAMLLVGWQSLAFECVGASARLAALLVCFDLLGIDTGMCQWTVLAKQWQSPVSSAHAAVHAWGCWVASAHVALAGRNAAVSACTYRHFTMRHGAHLEDVMSCLTHERAMCAVG